MDGFDLNEIKSASIFSNFDILVFKAISALIIEGCLRTKVFLSLDEPLKIWSLLRFNFPHWIIGIWGHKIDELYKLILCY